LKLCLLAEASSVHTRRWAAHFAARGDEVLVLSLRPGEIPGARVIAVAPRRLGRAGYLLGVPLTRAAVRRFRPDVLHAHFATSYGLLGALTGWHPLVISSWGSDVVGARRRGRLWSSLLRFAFARADAVCATSRFLAEATRPFVPPGRAITITPFGVDPERFRPRPRPAGRSFTIGTARARLEAIYGPAVLLDAFARMGHPDARLILYGGGETGSLRAAAERLGIAARVDLPGPVRHDEMPAALAALDVFVMPSLVPEAFGVAAVEASACGVPVVASAVGGLPEVVVDRESGRLVPAGDADALAAALRELADDEALRQRLGANGRAFAVREYCWSENARRMERLYERLFASSGYRSGLC
jgi:glycosyltransferase involved in cell wall biosynthesis